MKRVKVSVYMFCSLCAGIAGILEVGWLGTITTSLGQGMELSVIATSVIGGANRRAASAPRSAPWSAPR